jgi:competence protein ComFB
MKNLIESVVREIHGELKVKHPEFCTCTQCADDVVALVLNHSQPRYATTDTGTALANLDMWGDETRAELAVLVLDAMQRVAREPRHGASKTGR